MSLSKVIECQEALELAKENLEEAKKSIENRVKEVASLVNKIKLKYEEYYRPAHIYNVSFFDFADFEVRGGNKYIGVTYYDHNYDYREDREVYFSFPVTYLDMPEDQIIALCNQEGEAAKEKFEEEKDTKAKAVLAKRRADELKMLADLKAKYEK